MKLSECRTGSYQAQNIVLVNTSDDGVYLKPRSNSPIIQKTCLTIDTRRNKTITKSCDVKDNSFIWKLIEVEGKPGFLLYHPATNVYVGVGSNNRITMSQNAALDDNSYSWGMIKSEGNHFNPQKIDLEPRSSKGKG